MLNQIVQNATEANSSGLFLKNYLEYIEEFPGEFDCCKLFEYQ